TSRTNISLGLEVASASGQVGFSYEDCISGLFGFQRDGIATAGSSNALAINGSSAVAADDPVGAFGESHRAANLASVKHGCHLAVRLLIQPEADLQSALCRFEVVQVAI